MSEKLIDQWTNKGSIIFDEEEEEEENKLEIKKIEIKNEEIVLKTNINENVLKNNELKNEEKKDSFVFIKPITRETITFVRSLEKLQKQQEKSYVNILLTLRNSLLTSMEFTSKPLQNSSTLGTSVIDSKNKFNNIKSSILNIPIPHLNEK